MNIAKIMIPKRMTVFLHETDTVRQGLERFMVHGYTAVPVLNAEGRYLGSVTEGDLLRHLLTVQTTKLKAQEQYLLGSILRRAFCPALSIDAGLEEAVAALMEQNFVPVVDDRNILCGILTRKRIIEYLAHTQDRPNSSGSVSDG